MCFTETSQLAFSGKILTNLHGTEIVLGVQLFCGSVKSTAGELRFQQAVAENFGATLDFDNACIRDVCADAHILGTACAEIAGVGDRESLLFCVTRAEIA